MRLYRKEFHNYCCYHFLKWLMNIGHLLSSDISPALRYTKSYSLLERVFKPDLSSIFGSDVDIPTGSDYHLLLQIASRNKYQPAIAYGNILNNVLKLLQKNMQASSQSSAKIEDIEFFNPYLRLLQGDGFNLPNYLDWILNKEEKNTGSGAKQNEHHPDGENNSFQRLKFFVPAVLCQSTARFFCQKGRFVYHPFSISNFPVVDEFSCDANITDVNQVKNIRMGVPLTTANGSYSVNPLFSRFATSRNKDTQHLYFGYLPLRECSDSYQQQAEVACCNRIRTLSDNNKNFIICVLPYALPKTSSLFCNEMKFVSFIKELKDSFFSNHAESSLSYDFFLSRYDELINDSFLSDTLFELCNDARNDIGFTQPNPLLSVTNQRRFVRCFFYCHFRPYLRSQLPDLVSENHTCRDGIDRGRCAFAIEWLHHSLKRRVYPTLEDYFRLLHAPAMQVKGRLMNDENRLIFCDMAECFLRSKDFQHSIDKKKSQLEHINFLKICCDPKVMLQKIEEESPLRIIQASTSSQPNGFIRS